MSIPAPPRVAKPSCVLLPLFKYLNADRCLKATVGIFFVAFFKKTLEMQVNMHYNKYYNLHCSIYVRANYDCDQGVQPLGSGSEAERFVSL